MGQSLVNFCQVSKQYEGKGDEVYTVLNKVDFAVQEGEIFALMGPNGAGKTTLLKILLGLTAASAGKVLVGDMEVRRDRKVKELLGYVPEKVAFPPNLNAYETLRFYGGLRGVKHERCLEALEIVGLTKYAKQRVGTFSKGMNQRLGVAQAILARPRLLVLDEPTSGLDPVGVDQFKQLVQDLNREGLTILFTSHFLSEIEELAHRIAILQEGELCAVDSLAGLIERSGWQPQLEIDLSEPIPGLAAAARNAGAAMASLADGCLRVICPPENKGNVVEAVLQAGGRIRDIRTTEPSLETVFLRLLNRKVSTTAGESPKLTVEMGGSICPV